MTQATKSIKYLALAGCLAISGIAITDSYAQPTDTQTTPVISFKSGVTLNMEEIGQYQNFMMELKNGQSGSPLENLQNITLAECVKDLYTTGPKVEISKDLPERARMFLDMKLFQKISKETTVTQEALEKWANDNAEKYTERETVKGKHLFLQVDEDTPTSSAKVVAKKMEEIRSGIKDEKSFVEAVKKYSEAGTRAQDGDIGERYYRQLLGNGNRTMNPVLDNALFSLKKGELSPVLKTKTGLHLLFCVDHKTTHVPTLKDFIDRKILPNAALSSAIDQNMKAMIEKTKLEKSIKPAELKQDEPITTDTVLFTVGDDKFSAKKVGEIYGESFLYYFSTIINKKEDIEKLQTKLCDMFARTGLAQSKGLDKDNEKFISMLMKQNAFDTFFKKLVAEMPKVSDTEAEAFFKDNLDNPTYRFRIPEYAGFVASVKGTEEEAQGILNHLKTLDDKSLEEEIAKISVDDRKSSGGLIPLHQVNTFKDIPARQFDNFASQIDAGQWISKPVKTATGNWFIAKVTQKEKGQPMEFDERIKTGIKSFLENKAEMKLRAQILSDIKAKGLYKLEQGAKEMRVSDLVENGFGK